MSDNVIVVGGMSKSHAMTGLSPRLGARARSVDEADRHGAPVRRHLRLGLLNAGQIDSEATPLLEPDLARAVRAHSSASSARTALFSIAT
jgi:hypothetical protein